MGCDHNKTSAITAEESVERCIDGLYMGRKPEQQARAYLEF